MRLRLDADCATNPPQVLDRYREHAALSEHFAHDEGDAIFFVGVTDEVGKWPSLVVTQPSPGGYSYYPGVLVVPETRRVFIGAGERLLCYVRTKDGWARMWDDIAEFGFLRWHRHGDVVLMSAEVGLAAWTTDGLKLWSTFVEPPWDYTVVGDTVHLNVMGKRSDFPLLSGPLRPFAPKRRPAARRRSYCPDCRAAKEPQKDASAAYRLRRRDSVTA